MISEPTELPVYAGPQLPRWTPVTTDDVQRAIDEGDLAERHAVDVKLTQDFKTAAKKELARDLASFANDGGVLLYGVAEDKSTNALSIVPVELAGLAERFEEIARTRLEPPLFVTCRPIRVPDDPTRGVLLVEVPPSAQSPHQVSEDAAYFGRGDKTRIKLDDSAVARLHAVRRSRQASGAQLLEDGHRLERWPGGKNAHLFVVASPTSSAPDLLTVDLDRPTQLIIPVLQTFRDLPNTQWTGSFDALSIPVPVPRGVSFQSHDYFNYDAPHRNDDGEDQGFAVELQDDATVASYCSAVSFENGANTPWVNLARILFWSEGTIATAANFASLRGYSGSWTVAMAVTNLGGMADLRTAEAHRLRIWPRQDGDFVGVTAASTAELRTQPRTIVRRLTRRLLRGLGATEVYKPYFNPD